MHLLLHLYFRNPDGTLTWGAWWTLATVSTGWVCWGLSIVISPRWLTRYVRVSGKRQSGVLLRLIGVAVCAVGILVAVLLLRAAPGKLY